MFIPGMCRVWARRLADGEYWTKLPQAPRGYSDCESLVEYYESEWGRLYEYQITPDLDLCQPLA